MFDVLKRKGGFTLIETIVAIAMVAILSVVVLTVFLSVNRTYHSVVEANLIMMRAESALDLIKLSVQNCGEVVITDDAGAGPEAAIWSDNGVLYYKSAGGEPYIYMEDTRFDLSFSGEGSLLQIRLGAEAGGGAYELESAALLQNAAAIEGGGGSGIRFR